jgi:copper chaperone
MMKTTRIKVEGMHCDGCASRVKSLLKKESGVPQAEVRKLDRSPQRD